MRQEAVFTTPNLISFLRICLVPVVVIFLFSPDRKYSLLAALAFSVAALTDSLDGYLARRKNIVTTLGKYLDPVADKLLVAVSLIMLISLDRVESWIVMLIVERELAVTWLNLWLQQAEPLLSPAAWERSRQHCKLLPPSFLSYTMNTSPLTSRR